MKISSKKIITAFVFTLLFLSKSVSAQSLPINAYFFYGDGCPHCAQESQFIRQIIQNKYPNLKLYEYEIYNNQKNRLLLQKIANELGTRVDGIPFLIIGNQHYIGYTEGLTSELIETKIKNCSLSYCPDSLISILNITQETALNSQTIPTKSAETENLENKNQKIVNLPLIGEINALNFSLPILTIVMGALDGFNPCAMWTLLFLISLLLGMKDKKRMWILGATFIVASASVYFMFMAAWLNLILFLGLVIWVRIIIGLIAMIGGGYSLKEFIFNKNSGCKITGNEKRQKVFDKMRLAIQQNSLWLALGGIILLAFAVNLVELICSAGLPAVYTQILALNQMNNWQYYLYILLYILFFMIDDLLLFFVAMFTLQMTGITTKYARFSRLIGGLIMLAIGLMLIFKPGWLMFG